MVATENGARGVRFANGWFSPVANLEPAADGTSVIISVRPEELSVHDEGLPCRIESSVFLGKYMNYTLDFGENMVLPDQPGIEYSQDIGHAERVFANGETIKLLPNEKKFNVYSEDGSRSLIKGVVQYA